MEVDSPEPERHSRSTQNRSASSGSTSISVSSAARRFAASRSSAGRSASASASASAQCAWRSASGRASPAVQELLLGIEPHGLEQPVAALGAALLCTDERLLDQAAEDVGDLGQAELVAGAHGLGGPELEAAREHGEPAEEDALVGLEQIVAPAQRRREGLLPGRRRTGARAQEAEAVVEPLGDRRRPEAPDAPGRQLDRERQPVEAEADPRDVGRVLLREGEAGRDRGGALDEQADRLEVRRARHTGGSCSGSGIVSDGTRKTTSPGSRSGSRLVASMVRSRRRAEQRLGERCARRQDVLAVVEHEQQRPPGEEAGQRVRDLLPRERAHVERGGDGVSDEPGIEHGRELDEYRAVDERLAARFAPARARGASCRRPRFRPA